MTRPKTAAAAAAVLALVTIASVAGCQWLNENLPVPSLAPTASSATPHETDQERIMRLDKEAAEKAYLAAAHEGDRLAIAGGANAATKVLEANAAGAYLDSQVASFRQLKRQGLRIDRATAVTVTANRGWSPTEVGLTACEDASKVRLLNRAGKEVLKDRDRLFVQYLTASKIGNRWKITAADGKAVKSFDYESGCQP